MTVAVALPVPHLWPDRYGDELYAFALHRVSAREAAEELVPLESNSKDAVFFARTTATGTGASRSTRRPGT